MLGPSSFPILYRSYKCCKNLCEFIAAFALLWLKYLFPWYSPSSLDRIFPFPLPQGSYSYQRITLKEKSQLAVSVTCLSLSVHCPDEVLFFHMPQEEVSLIKVRARNTLIYSYSRIPLRVILLLHSFGRKGVFSFLI